MIPRLLLEPEFHETFSAQMVDIKGQEDVVQPEGVIDLEPYLRAIPEADFEGLSLLPDAPPAAVYRGEEKGFDHVLYPCSRSNVYLVVVVAFRPDHVHGHSILDLAQEYGLDRGRLTGA